MVSSLSGGGPTRGDRVELEFTAVESMDALTANSFRVEDRLAGVVYPQITASGFGAAPARVGESPRRLRQMPSDRASRYGATCWAFGAWRLSDDYGTRKIGPAVGLERKRIW